MGGPGCGRQRDRSRGGYQERASHMVPLPLVVHEVEQLVLLDGSAKTGAELLQTHRCLRRRHIEEVPSIQGGRAAKGERSAVHPVAARLYPGVDDGPRLPAVFRLWILFGIKFLDGVDGRDVDESPAAIAALSTLEPV